MTIEERFENLEKENQALKNQTRKLRKLSFVSIALALAGFVGGTALSVRAYTAAIEPTSVTTHAITLKDTSNRTRLVLAGAGFINAYDENGKVRASLSSGGVLAVRDSGGLYNRVLINAADNKIYFKDASGVTVKTLP